MARQSQFELRVLADTCGGARNGVRTIGDKDSQSTPAGGNDAFARCLAYVIYQGKLVYTQEYSLNGRYALRTEVRKEFRHGFVLTEDELRRIVDCATQSMKRVLNNAPFKTRFHAGFRDGTIAECDGVDDLLGFDNSGAKQIVGIHVHVSEDGPSSRHQVLVDFSNPLEDKRTICPIEFRVRGEDRDWAHITSSQIAERAAKVKATSLAWPWLRYGSLLFSLCVAIFLFSSVAGMFIARPRQSHAAEALAAAVRENPSLDAVHAILLVEQINENERRDEVYRIIKDALIMPVALVLFLLFLVYVGHYLFPSYIFYWADAIKVYDRRLAARRYVLIAVITGLLVSVVGGMLVSKISIVH